MNPFLDGPRAVLDLAGIRAWTTANMRARAAYYANACGTTAGFRRNVNHGETVCPDCRNAYRDWARRHYAKKRRKA